MSVPRGRACTQILAVALTGSWASSGLAQQSDASLDAPSGGASHAFEDDPGLVPYPVPRETLVPGTPGMPGGVHLMINGFAEAQNAGHRRLHASRTPACGASTRGATYPLLVDDWAMAYGRDAHGWIEGLLMLDFEPLTVGSAGYPRDRPVGRGPLGRAARPPVDPPGDGRRASAGGARRLAPRVDDAGGARTISPSSPARGARPSARPSSCTARAAPARPCRASTTRARTRTRRSR